jgi:hypothetical protein
MREEGSKGKGFLGSSMWEKELMLHEGGKGQDCKGQDYSPIRKSYRLPEPKKHPE